MKKIYNILLKASLIFLVFIVLLEIFKKEELITFLNIVAQQTAQIGTLFLYLMLFCKSLYFILKKLKILDNNGRLMKFLRNNNKYQREQGLIIFNLLFIHGYVETINYISDFNLLVYNYLNVLIPTIILIYMELTSFSPLQKLLRKWKKSHTIIWLSLPLILLHIVVTSNQLTKYLIFTIILVLIAIIEFALDIKNRTKHIIYIVIGTSLTLFQLKVLNIYENLYLTNFVESIPLVEKDTSGESTTNSSESEANINNLSQSSNQEVDKDQNSVNINSESANDETTETPATYTYQNGTFQGEGFGHRGPIVVQTTIENDDIIDIEIVSENEDTDWWIPVVNTIPGEIIDNDSTEGIQYVAGSTHSSEGLLQAVEESLEDAKY